MTSVKSMMNLEKLRHGPARKLKTASENMIQSSKSEIYVLTWVTIGVMLGSIFRDFSKIFKISQINFWSSQIVSGMSKSVPNLPNYDFKLTRSFKFDENWKISKLTQKMKRYEGCSARSNALSLCNWFLHGAKHSSCQFLFFLNYEIHQYVKM